MLCIFNVSIFPLHFLKYTLRIFYSTLYLGSPLPLLSFLFTSISVQHLLRHTLIISTPRSHSIFYYKIIPLCILRMPPPSYHYVFPMFQCKTTSIPIYYLLFSHYTNKTPENMSLYRLPR